MNLRIAKNIRGRSWSRRDPVHTWVDGFGELVAAGTEVVANLGDSVHPAGALENVAPRDIDLHALRSCDRRYIAQPSYCALCHQHDRTVGNKHWCGSKSCPIGLFSPDRSADAKCLLTHHTRLQYMHCNTPAERSVGDFRRFH